MKKKKKKLAIDAVMVRRRNNNGREASLSPELDRAATKQPVAMAMVAAAGAPTCARCASPVVSRSRVRAQATSWAGGAEALVRSGTVKAVRPKDAAEALGAEGFRLLDVRPEWERARASVRGSAHVPLFEEDDDMGPVTLLKKWVHFGYIGLWTGQAFTKMNDGFVDDVAAAVAGDGGKDARLLVACGEGLRSLIAVRMLHDGGYRNLAWLAGGFSKCADGDFADVEGESKLQYATIGGVSYIFLQLLLLLGVVK